MKPQFWQDKRVFITGITGFKGGWLSHWLNKMGAIIYGYALKPPTQPNIFEVTNVSNSVHTEIGDIRDFICLKNAIDSFQPDIIFHLAAQPLVRYSYVQPIETYETNVMGTVNLLEAIRQNGGVRVVINVTSDKCYENQEWVWGYREHEAMGGYDPYSNSKGCAELVTSAFRNSFFNVNEYEKHGVALASVRAGNVIGGGDWADDRLIPDILRSIELNKPILIRSPHAIRPWQHVLEPLSGYIQLAEKLWYDATAFSEGWNFGPSDDDARNVQWIAERIVKLWGHGASWQLDESIHPHEAHYLKLDCSKARSKLGWTPRWSLENTLERIVLWHKAHNDGMDMKSYTLEEIKAYEQTIVKES